MKRVHSVDTIMFAMKTIDFNQLPAGCHKVKRKDQRS